jgi:hypothetical protein
MKMKTTIIMTAILLTAVMGMAQTASAGYFADRQQQQERRIEQGIARGQITPREADALYQDQRELRQLKRYFVADGDLSQKEAYVLLKHLKSTNAKIDRYKHNHRRVEPPLACRPHFRPYARR